MHKMVLLLWDCILHINTMQPVREKTKSCRLTIIRPPLAYWRPLPIPALPGMPDSYNSGTVIRLEHPNRPFQLLGKCSFFNFRDSSGH